MLKDGVFIKKINMVKKPTAIEIKVLEDKYFRGGGAKSIKATLRTTPTLTQKIKDYKRIETAVINQWKEHPDNFTEEKGLLQYKG